MITPKKKLMQLAIKEAKLAQRQGDYAVGAVSVAVWARLKGVVYGARYQDMTQYRKKHANHHYLWRTIHIPCREIFRKSTEKVELVKDFMRKECVALFHNE